MLRWRLLSAAVIILGLVGFLWLDYNHPLRGVGGVWLLPIMLAATGLAVGELVDLLRGKNLAPALAAAYGGTFAIVGLTCVPLLWPLSGKTYPLDCPLGRSGWPLAGVAAAVGLTIVTEIVQYGREKQPILRLDLHRGIGS